ncbi:UNVERIFIED_CONTAM: Retrovirus-related Pol polyprotein from transposon RE1 [Sesamum indicum]
MGPLIAITPIWWRKLDLNNAFLHGFLEQDVYMDPPEGFLGVFVGQRCSSDFTALLVYVDDILLTGSSSSILDSVKSYLDRLFTIKDLGSAKYFVGLELARSSHGLHTESKYLQDILADTSMLDAKPAYTPLPLGLKLVLDDGSSLHDPNRFWQLTKKQATVSRSSADAEFWSIASTVCELLWISYVLHGLHVSVPLPISFWCDNNAALHITANPVFHERTKHLYIDCHIVRDQFKLGFISPSHIRGSYQVVDLFTKSLPAPIFGHFLYKLGLASSTPS